MDKKNTIIGVLLLCAAFYFMFESNKEAEAVRQQQVSSAQKVEAKPVQQKTPKAEASIISALKDCKNEQTCTLENNFIKVLFTNCGGAIKNVEMLKYLDNQQTKTPYVFNNVKNSLPAMSAGIYDDSSFLPKPLLSAFNLVKKSDTEVEYKLVIPQKFEITRQYMIVKEDKDNFQPYTILTKTTIKNLSKQALNLREISFYLGTVPPTASDVYGSNLAYVLFNTDNDTVFSRSSSFIDSSGFLGIGASKALEYEKINEPAKWASIKNQFFASVFTPYQIEACSGVAIPVQINASSDDKYMKNAIGGFVNFNVPTIEAGKEWSIEGAYYAGPKELDRLYSIGGKQEEIMNYGWFGFVSRPLSRLLNWIHSWVDVISPNWGWGWAIIILTLVVRLVLWPLTSIQIKSSQRMAKMQEPLKEIREKFKNDPKRVQQETMKLYSEYGINPLAGCLPILIQIPIFIGLYYMLQTSCEIRFAHFLWIKDLSLPDTIECLPSITIPWLDYTLPIHILPLLNAFVTFVQMHLTPTPSTDKSQAMMFKIMPVIMLLFFYSFPSGLVLYWLVQSLLGIVQAIIIRRGKDKVELKKRTKPGFLQRMQEAMEQAQAQQQKRGPEFDKLPLRERLRIAREDAIKARQKAQHNRYGEQIRKKNPGGRSTKPKNR